MKSIVRWVYLLLVGLIVLTGALFIAKGALDGDQNPVSIQNSSLEDDEGQQTDDHALPTPEFHAPDGPAQFI